MEDLKKLICSHWGHKGHLPKLVATTEDLLGKLSKATTENANDASVHSDIVLLTENLKQIRIKARVFEELDDKIIVSTEEKEKLEQVVFEAADLQASLSEKMAVIRHTLQMFSETVVAEPAAATTHTIPPPQPQEVSDTWDETQETTRAQQLITDQVDYMSSANNNT